jgi:DNA-binding NarL/FixJ family response regulator
MTLEQRSPVKVAIVSNNILLLLGLRRFFEEHIGIVVVGESPGGSSACNLIAQQRPDVILVDIESDLKSAEAINDFRQKEPLSRIIVLSGWDEMDRARQALATGADEIVMKCQQPGVLLATVECLGKGLTVPLRATSYQPPITNKVEKRKAVAEPVRCTDALTDREREVISLLGKGLSNRDIANSLCISETTVRHHLTSIFDKLGVSNRQKLLICAHQYGLVELTASA